MRPALKQNVQRKWCEKFGDVRVLPSGLSSMLGGFFSLHVIALSTETTTAGKNCLIFHIPAHAAAEVDVDALRCT